MRKELEKIVAEKIIAPVTEPTYWVSSVLAFPKRYGSVPICLDPKDLNNTIKRSHYSLPTVEDVTSRVTNAKVFTVLDAKGGFWQVKLSDISTLYTTFNTPFGWFRWLRMPLVISSAPAVWQRKMHNAIESLQGREVIADNFLVCGYGDTVDKAVTDRDRNLTVFLQRCREHNLTLDPQKIKVCHSQMPFELVERFYALRIVKHSGAPPKDLTAVYCAFIRLVLEYTCQAWHFTLPQWLADEIESVQRRALRIALPNLLFAEALDSTNLHKFKQRRQARCQKLYRDILVGTNNAREPTSGT